MCLLLTLATSDKPTFGGELVFKNGFRIEGKAPIGVHAMNRDAARKTSSSVSFPILMLEDGYRRYLVSKASVAKDGINSDALLSKYETFKLEQRRLGGRKAPVVVGGFKAGPFSEFGRRTLSLKMGGKILPVIQGITEVTPTYLQLSALEYEWQPGIATTSIPPETLHAILMKAIDQDDPADRRAVCRFYIQAEMFLKATEQIKALRRDYPDDDDLEAVETMLHQQQARVLLIELRRRQTAGQHELTIAYANKFPMGNLGAEASRRIRELIADYETRTETLDDIDSQLSDIQAEIDDKDLKAEVAAARQELSDQLDLNSVNRLSPFINLSKDPDLDDQQKLALAFSGWMLGPENAITDLRQTLNLWKARFLLLEIIRSKNINRQAKLTTELKRIEGIGHERVVQLIPNLPPLMESSGLETGVPLTVKQPPLADGRPPVAYSIVLPPEYSPNKTYPMIVTLRPQNRTIESQLSFWAGTPQQQGQAQRHGYIVIAPHYIDQENPKYEHDARSHQVVVDSIIDARKRFMVDSDRVFLTGHGVGGDAAFDIGMSHPDFFAGVLPFTGLLGPVCKWYWRNSVNLSWYIVAGELDRQSLEHNATTLNQMMRYRHNVVYVEYIGRGYEAYYEEIHRVFDWMSYQKRTEWPSEIKMSVKRPMDNSFYWVKAYGLNNNLLKPTARVMKITGDVSKGNTLRLSSGGKTHDLYLSPQFVDFDKKLTVYKGTSKKRFSGGLTPSITDTLDGLRETGDRQQLRWQRLRIQ